MITRTTHMSGLAAGAARIGTCPAYLVVDGTAMPAPIHGRTWLAGLQTKQVSPVFTTDRPIPRPLERSP
jgi:hypothetical protein